jgi:hypothetical protein
MRLLRYLMLPAVAALAVTFAPEPALAGCETCEYDQGTWGCLLGCPLYAPTCRNYSDCQSGQGWCTEANACGGFAAETGVGVTVAGSAHLNDAATTQELLDQYAAFEESAGVMYRRSCDASIVRRDYSEAAVNRMNVEATSLTI